MKKTLSLTITLLLMTLGSLAQVTWADDVAEIIYANCSACHRDAGIAPFPLIDYTNDVQGNENAILDAVGTGYMPPWTVDSDYQDYARERILSDEEIQTIVDWVNTGSQPGNLADVPPPPVYMDEGFISVVPDLELQMEEYTSNASASFDDYVCFSIPTGLIEDKRVKAFEVIPGNTEIVHHALIYVDEEGTYETNTSGLCNGPVLGLIGGYTPGAFPTVFPSDGADFNLGVTLPAGSNIVFAMHYPNGSAGQTDQTKIRFYFYDDDTPVREVLHAPVLSNWDFTIEAFTTEEVTAEFTNVLGDVSLLSVFPHMHLIGEYIETYAVTPETDTIPLARIPHWDFDWQEFYLFEQMLHIPNGTVLHGKGIYENLPGNPHNPNDPPIDISAGLNTTDEMFLIYFGFLAYEEGDELVDLEELTQIPTGLYDFTLDGGSGVSTFPNPFEDDLTFTVDLQQSARVSLYIYDQLGQLIDIVSDKQDLGQGEHRLTWQPSADVVSGVYYYSVNIDGNLGSGKVVRSKTN